MKVPLGNIEPHAPLLTSPVAGQLLYKIMSVDNLYRSIFYGYLHFNRVDSYADFPGADSNDGKQLPCDRKSNATLKFVNAPQYSAADYYDESRKRTYACCFSLEESEHIWNSYGLQGKHGNVCIVFNYDKLKEYLNKTVQADIASVICNGSLCRQIFSINYGIVKYVDWNTYLANASGPPNPIEYTHIKDSRYSSEKEMRITLTTIGIGELILNDGSPITLPPHLHLSFNYRYAINNHIIEAMNCTASPDIQRTLMKLHEDNIAAILD